MDLQDIQKLMQQQAEMIKKQAEVIEQLQKDLERGKKESPHQTTILESDTILGSDLFEESQSLVGKPEYPQTSKTEKSTQQTNIDTVAAGGRTIVGKTPLILFIGPASCGKSMVMMSLAEYIARIGYDVETNKRYIPGSKKYEDSCETFDDLLHDNIQIQSGNPKIPLPGTVDEILVDVLINKGQTKQRIYRMLEAPGEHFFSLSNPRKGYEQYLKNIISKNRVNDYPIYFVMLLDLHTNKDRLLTDDILRKKYEARLIDFFNNGYNRSRGDRVILLYNKFDCRDTNVSETQSLSSLLQTYYPRIKEAFKYTVIGRFDAYKLLPYVSGNYYKVQDSRTGLEYERYTTDNIALVCAKDLWNLINVRWFN